MSIVKKAGPAAVAALIVLSASPAVSHEHWFDPGEFYPAAGTAVRFGVCSGHHYPESSFAVKDEVYCGVMLVRPGGQAEKTATSRAETFHAGSFEAGAAGVHLLTLALKRPMSKDPVFELKAIIIAGGGDDPAGYASGKGLEIVPGIALSAAEAPCEIPVHILLDGRRVEGALTLFDDKGENAGLKAGLEKPALIAVNRSGRYLLVAEAGERECSLVFEIGGSGSKE